MVIPRTFIERTVIPTRRGWRVTIHSRPRKSIFTKQPRAKLFDTEADALEWMRGEWLASPRRTTRSVMWVTDGLVPTQPYSGLPELRTRGTTIYLDGQTVATGYQTGRELKRQILNHPRGNCLSAVPCAKCGRLPRINLINGTLVHTHEDCPTWVRMDPHALTPPPLQIAVWNRRLWRRLQNTHLEPMTIPHFMILGALREPTEHELVGRIRNIEIL